MRPPVDSGMDVATDLGGSEDMAAADAADDRSTNCPARFNFEGGMLAGATINSNSLKAFTMIANSNAVTLCGTGALEIDATFMGGSGAYTGGEVDIPLTGTEDLSGKTLTINVRTVPPGNVSFFLLLATAGGFEGLPFNPLSLTLDQWYTASYSFPALDGGVQDGGIRDGGLPDGGVPYMWAVDRLALEAFSYNADAIANYKIYVDEIDIR